MQRTLKRELKVLEIVKGEAAGSSTCARSDQPGRGSRPRPASRLLAAAGRGTAPPDGGTLAGAGQHLRGRGQEPSGGVVGRGPRGLCPATRPAVGPLHPAEGSQVTPQGWTGPPLGPSGDRDSSLCRPTGGLHWGTFACHLGMLAKWPPPSRLETRTKESNICASQWVENPEAK